MQDGDPQGLEFKTPALNVAKITVSCIDGKNTKRENKKHKFVPMLDVFCDSPSMYKSDGCLFNKQTKCHMHGGNFIYPLSHSLNPLCIFQIFASKKKILVLLAYFSKKKKKTLWH